MKRKSFFKYAGAAVMSIIAVASSPWKLVKAGESKKTSIKITVNPNAVKRKAGVSKHA